MHSSISLEEFYGYENDENIYEEHLSNKCKMIRKRYIRKNQIYFIFLRQCFCNQYPSVSNSDVNFRKISDMNQDGVFIHFHGRCFRKYRQYNAFIITNTCNCNASQEYLSYSR